MRKYRSEDSCHFPEGPSQEPACKCYGDGLMGSGVKGVDGAINKPHLYYQNIFDCKNFRLTVEASAYIVKERHEYQEHRTSAESGSDSRG